MRIEDKQDVTADVSFLSASAFCLFLRVSPSVLCRCRVCVCVWGAVSDLDLSSIFYYCQSKPTSGLAFERLGLRLSQLLTPESTVHLLLLRHHFPYPGLIVSLHDNKSSALLVSALCYCIFLLVLLNRTSSSALVKGF